MFKHLAVVAISAGVGVVLGDMAADKLLKIDAVAKQNETVKKGLKFGTQGAAIVLTYGLARSFIR